MYLNISLVRNDLITMDYQYTKCEYLDNRGNETVGQIERIIIAQYLSF